MLLCGAMGDPTNMTKVTIRIPAAVLERARAYAASKQTSISRLVTNYLSQLPPEVSYIEDAPIVRSLVGTLSPDVTIDDYHRHLDEKYGDASQGAPRFASYEETADFWDTHSLADTWDETEPAEFEIDPNARRRYLVAVDRELLARAQRLALARGLSTESLVNLLLEQRLTQLEAAI